MSSAASALIWWIVPAIGLIGGLTYVLWISKFQGKYQQGTQRSVSQFQRFQDSLRDSQARDVATDSAQDKLEPINSMQPPLPVRGEVKFIKPDATSDSLDDNPFLKKP